MKRITQIILLLTIVVNLSSCHTTEKFTVYGNEGTEIYSPNQVKLGTINNQGEANITVSSDECYTYLLAKDAGSAQFVPFALDYKNKSYSGNRILLITEAAIGVSCLFGVLVSTIVLAIEGDMPPVLALPMLIAAPVAFAGMATSERLDQTTRDWKFTYQKKQQTNSDIQFTQPIYSEPAKQLKSDDSFSRQTSNETLSGTGWKTKPDNVTKLPFKNGSFEVSVVNTHYNGDNIQMKPEGKVTINDNIINISINDNSFLENKTLTITKNLQKNKTFGKPERTYSLYSTSDGQEVGLYFDNSLESIGVVEQRILIQINESVSFEIVWL